MTGPPEEEAHKEHQEVGLETKEDKKDKSDLQSVKVSLSLFFWRRRNWPQLWTNWTLDVIGPPH